MNMMNKKQRVNLGLFMLLLSITHWYLHAMDSTVTSFLECVDVSHVTNKVSSVVLFRVIETSQLEKPVFPTNKISNNTLDMSFHKISQKVIMKAKQIVDIIKCISLISVKDIVE